MIAGPEPGAALPASRCRQSKWTRTLLRTFMLMRGPASTRYTPGCAPPHTPSPPENWRYSGRVKRHSPVDESVAAVEPDHARLQIGVELEIPGHGALINPSFGEQREGVAAGATVADALAALGGEPQRNAAHRLDSHSARDFGAAPADVGAGAEAGRDLAREIVGEASARLAAAELPAAGERRRPQAHGLLTAQERPAAQLDPVERPLGHWDRGALRR